MNNIYVDELPKKCKDCPCMNNDGFGGYDCNLYYKKHKEILSCDYYADTIPKHCPLKPLSDRLAEERKKVVQEIDCELYTKMVVYGDTPSYADIHSVLNKIKENSV